MHFSTTFSVIGSMTCCAPSLFASSRRSGEGSMTVMRVPPRYFTRFSMIRPMEPAPDRQTVLPILKSASSMPRDAVEIGSTRAAFLKST